jgi:hypothetical protein
LKPENPQGAGGRWFMHPDGGGESGFYGIATCTLVLKPVRGNKFQVRMVGYVFSKRAV